MTMYQKLSLIIQICTLIIVSMIVVNKKKNKR